jgi:hypothetical protein
MERDRDEEGGREEDRAKGRKLQKKMDAFLAEIGADLLDEEAIESLSKLVRRKLTEAEVGYTIVTLKAFLEGVQFGVHSTMNDMVPLALAGLNVLVKREKAKAKAKAHADGV